MTLAGLVTVLIATLYHPYLRVGQYFPLVLQQSIVRMER
jgi:hypothetical protein